MLARKGEYQLLSSRNVLEVSKKVIGCFIKIIRLKVSIIIKVRRIDRSNKRELRRHIIRISNHSSHNL